MSMMGKLNSIFDRAKQFFKEDREHGLNLTKIAVGATSITRTGVEFKGLDFNDKHIRRLVFLHKRTKNRRIKKKLNKKLEHLYHNNHIYTYDNSDFSLGTLFNKEM